MCVEIATHSLVFILYHWLSGFVPGDYQPYYPTKLYGKTILWYMAFVLFEFCHTIASWMISGITFLNPSSSPPMSPFACWGQWQPRIVQHQGIDSWLFQHRLLGSYWSVVQSMIGRHPFLVASSKVHPITTCMKFGYWGVLIVVYFLRIVSSWIVLKCEQVWLVSALYLIHHK